MKRTLRMFWYKLKSRVSLILMYFGIFWGEKYNYRNRARRRRVDRETRRRIELMARRRAMKARKKINYKRAR